MVVFFDGLGDERGDSMKDEALKLGLEALTRYVNEDDICEGMPGNEPWVETKYMGEAAITAIKQALAAPVQGSVTVLPDGSAFALASFPLPNDHWLYRPHEYMPGAFDPVELPSPITTHADRERVTLAVRYAIRGATMCGKEMDFDPDALVQNAVYALCGPFGTVTQDTPPAAQRQCNWPTCQSEEYQQSLAEQIKQELVTGAAQPAVPDAIIEAGESPDYRDGWNDCRAEMLKGMKS